MQLTPKQLGIILSQTVVTEECWEWRGRHVDGYSVVDAGGTTPVVHRLLWQMLFGEIPKGLEPDHLCRNRGCLNPDHLELVTHAENVRRGKGRVDYAVCGEGHILRGKNAYIRPSRPQYISCLICSRRQSRESMRSKRLDVTGS